nr:MAG TPA: hypothetical protein [Caudoviricetes sp.]
MYLNLLGYSFCKIRLQRTNLEIWGQRSKYLVVRSVVYI